MLCLLSENNPVLNKKHDLSQHWLQSSDPGMGPPCSLIPHCRLALATALNPAQLAPSTVARQESKLDDIRNSIQMGHREKE